MYLSDIDNKVRDFGLLEGLDSTEYGRYRDTMSDWYNDRDFAYNQYRDDVGDYYTDRDFSYNQYRDGVSDQRYDQEWNYSQEQESRDTAYSQAMQFLAAGVMPSDELLSRAGISRSEARSYLNGGDVSTPYRSALPTYDNTDTEPNIETQDDDDQSKDKSSAFYDVSRAARSKYERGKSSDDIADYLFDRIEDKSVTKEEAAKIALNLGIKL